MIFLKKQWFYAPLDYTISHNWMMQRNFRMNECCWSKRGRNCSYNEGLLDVGDLINEASFPCRIIYLREIVILKFSLLNVLNKVLVYSVYYSCRHKIFFLFFLCWIINNRTGIINKNIFKIWHDKTHNKINKLLNNKLIRLS